MRFLKIILWQTYLLLLSKNIVGYQQFFNESHLANSIEATKYS